jgi:hypothetical protein
MSFFLPATLVHEGRTLELTLAELVPIESRGNYWHGAREPSTWLAVSVFLEARRKYPGVPDGPLLDLAASAMGITVASLRDSIAFNESYMRWHDGDTDYRIL